MTIQPPHKLSTSAIVCKDGFHLRLPLSQVSGSLKETPSTFFSSSSSCFLVRVIFMHRLVPIFCPTVSRGGSLVFSVAVLSNQTSLTLFPCLQRNVGMQFPILSTDVSSDDMPLTPSLLYSALGPTCKPSYHH